MLGWLVKRRLAAFERTFDYDASYIEELYDVSPRAFWKFSRISALAQHREGVPKEAWHAAKIVAALTEDCGPCTQLAVTMAERAGVSSETLSAILTEDQRAMSPDAALGYAFAKAVLNRDLAESDRLRGEVVARWGRPSARVPRARDRRHARLPGGEIRARTCTSMLARSCGGSRGPRCQASNARVNRTAFLVP